MFFEIMCLLIVMLILYISKWKGKYWYRRKIDGPPPIILFGNMFDYIFQRKHYAEICNGFYQSYPMASYIGFYKIFNKPAILIRDLQLIKDILIKNFNHFQDNDFTLDENLDPLFTNSPFAAKGSKWKLARSHIAPMLTQNRIKHLQPIIESVCARFLNYISDEIKVHDEFEAKRLSSSYILEMVASSVFGIEAETFKRKDSNFQLMTDKVFSPHQRATLKTTATLFLPFLSTLLRMPFITPDIDQWLKTIFHQCIKLREQQQRNNNLKLQQIDILQSLIDLKNDKKLTESNICGYASSFLFDGYDTTSTVMAYSLYELAQNLDVQRMAQSEIDDILSCKGTLTDDESLNELHYIEAIINESLRMHPPMLVLAKICTENYTLPEQYPQSNQEVLIEKGTTIILPVHSIHRDPNIFNDPDTFNPDRFYGENRKDQDKYAFLGFGSGPRICLGMRFAMVQIKAGLATLLSKYNIELSSKTQIPLKISRKTFLLQCDEGIWIKLVKRT